VASGSFAAISTPAARRCVGNVGTMSHVGWRPRQCIEIGRHWRRQDACDWTAVDRVLKKGWQPARPTHGRQWVAFADRQGRSRSAKSPTRDRLALPKQTLARLRRSPAVEGDRDTDPSGLLQELSQHRRIVTNRDEAARPCPGKSQGARHCAGAVDFPDIPTCLTPITHMRQSML
jgi:hypothetical protein